MLASEKERTAELTKANSEQAAKIEDYEEKERAFETERRRLHNTIQELKVRFESNELFLQHKLFLSIQGNIRVFCRIRPLLGDEVTKAANGEIRHIDVQDEKAMALIRTVGEWNLFNFFISLF